MEQQQVSLNIVSVAAPPKRRRLHNNSYATKRKSPNFKPSLKRLDVLLNGQEGQNQRRPFAVLRTPLAPAPAVAEPVPPGDTTVTTHPTPTPETQNPSQVKRKRQDNVKARQEAAKRAKHAPLHRMTTAVPVAPHKQQEEEEEEEAKAEVEEKHENKNPKEDQDQQEAQKNQNQDPKEVATAPHPEQGFLSRPLTIQGGGLFSNSSFQDLGLAPTFTEHLTNQMNKKRPTQVQAATIPQLLQGRDVFVRAETGSGKTLAYGIPMVQHLQSFADRLNRTDGTYAIIIAPTRELAVQIFDVMTELLRPFHWIVPSLVVGGEKKKSEKARLRKGVSILVATPGRLLDHLQHTHSFKLHPIQWLVLDEADRLLDMGFENSLRHIGRLVDERAREPDIGGILHEVLPRRTALISATMTRDVIRLAQGVGSILRNDPIFIDIHTRAARSNSNYAKDSEQQEGGPIALPKNLDQNYVIVPCKKRLITLAAFLRWQQQQNKKGCKIIVFMSCIASVEYHSALFGLTMMPTTISESIETENGGGKKEPLLTMKIYKLHGNLSQVDRSNAYASFCRCTAGVLFCTDVASRGLDLPAVNWIVQYDPSGEPSEYIHRVGRTARLGHKGRSLLFLMPEEDEYIQLLHTHFGLSMRKVSMASILRTMPSGGAADELAGAWQLQLDLEQLVKDDKEQGGTLGEQARDAFCSFVKAYTTHVAGERHIFHVKNLHLGHLAKSFGLVDPPSSFKQQNKKEETEHNKKLPKKPSAQPATGSKKRLRRYTDH
eukprot:TRINITY_DN4343_c0_g1_i5.p1 TRINITY_DN4343_c0_g1~~TRINITY_DN4343_c0_g1_i5.p1  ORF type:complete len:781 (+),score=128.75 TRINITY_DN4343_c0_g1_i5:29-2344(+)